MSQPTFSSSVILSHATNKFIGILHPIQGTKINNINDVHLQQTYEIETCSLNKEQCRTILSLPAEQENLLLILKSTNIQGINYNKTNSTNSQSQTQPEIDNKLHKKFKDVFIHLVLDETSIIGHELFKFISLMNIYNLTLSIRIDDNKSISNTVKKNLALVINVFIAYHMIQKASVPEGCLRFTIIDMNKLFNGIDQNYDGSKAIVTLRQPPISKKNIGPNVINGLLSNRPPISFKICDNKRPNRSLVPYPIKYETTRLTQIIYHVKKD